MLHIMNMLLSCEPHDKRLLVSASIGQLVSLEGLLLFQAFHIEDEYSILSIKYCNPVIYTSNFNIPAQSCLVIPGKTSEQVRKNVTFIIAEYF